MRKTILLLIAVFAFASCEKETEISFSDTESQLIADFFAGKTKRFKQSTLTSRLPSACTWDNAFGGQSSIIFTADDEAIITVCFDGECSRRITDYRNAVRQCDRIALLERLQND